MAAAKIVLEPVFEADFQPCSYGFRPGRRSQHAIAEVQYLTIRGHEWVSRPTSRRALTGSIRRP
jgi:RNA-directed DNA polymerase